MKIEPLTRRRGFTLVEMLVVVIIIGILAAITVPAIAYARRKALITQIAVEIDNIEKSLELCKLKLGGYPPDFSNKQVVERYIRTAWPRIDNAELNNAWQVFWVDPVDNTNHDSIVDPAEAVVFWLGGFSTDAKFPFTGPGGPWKVVAGTTYGNPDRTNALFTFDKARLTQTLIPVQDVLASNDETDIQGLPAAANDIFPVYYPKNRKEPFVYFDARTYAVSHTYPPYLPSTVLPPPSASRLGLATPYLTDVVKRTNPLPILYKWAGEDKYQIISAGLDGHYGSGLVTRRISTGTGFSSEILPVPMPPPYSTLAGEGDDGNITNFSEGKELKDHVGEAN